MASAAAADGSASATCATWLRRSSLAMDAMRRLGTGKLPDISNAPSLMARPVSRAAAAALPLACRISACDTSGSIPLRDPFSGSVDTCTGVMTGLCNPASCSVAQVRSLVARICTDEQLAGYTDAARGTSGPSRSSGRRVRPQIALRRLPAPPQYHGARIHGLRRTGHRGLHPGRTGAGPDMTRHPPGFHCSENTRNPPACLTAARSPG